MSRRREVILTGDSRGLSLIELLATLMILSLAATMAIGVAGPMAAGQRRAAAIGAVEQALERARLIAEVRGSANLHFDGDRLRIVTEQRDEDPATLVSIVQMPAGWIAELRIDDVPAEQLRFDAAGRCVDVTVVVRLKNVPATAAMVEFLGVTGQMRMALDAIPEASP